MKKEILDILMNTDDFLSGERISRELGVSRMAVCKHIKSMRDDGIAISSRTKAGYRLIGLPDHLKKDYIRALLKDDTVRIVCMDETESTNELAKKEARNGCPDKSVFIAERQTKAKGRLGRKWEAPFGQAVQLSILVRPPIRPRKGAPITFAAALGVVNAIQEVCGVKAVIKWPNDIVYGGRKLCGILTEMCSDEERIEYIICGIGVNVNQVSFPAEIAEKATSLYLITGKKVDRLRLAVALIQNVLIYFQRYIKSGMSGIYDEYCENSSIIGKTIKVLQNQTETIGLCTGITRDGNLQLKTNDGTTEFFAGEVSVRMPGGFY